MSHFLFVYGTLKQGYGNNQRCLADAKFLGKALSVERDYIMQDIGFPIVWQDDDDMIGQVSGELFFITNKMLANCDRLEGHPRMYKREERVFQLTSLPGRVGEEITAWIYLWQGDKDYGDPIKLMNGIYTWDIEGGRSRS